MIDPHDGERLVDIGAGMGPATVTAAKAGAIVVAVDPTPFMRRVLGLRRLWQRSRSHILITDGAAEALHIADATCDGLWAVNSMHHWTNVSIAIGEIHRVLRPGGRVVLVDESFDDPTHPWFARMQKRRAGHHRHFDDIDPTSFAALMSAAGFSSATGESGVVAGRPAKIVRATK
jgi:ubiquinone/menaquinone biosynthesis C-methylase UbiE